MSKQKGIRVTTYMSEREKKMLDEICSYTKENMSQVVNALIMQEYYRLQSWTNPNLVPKILYEGGDILQEVYGLNLPSLTLKKDKEQPT